MKKNTNTPVATRTAAATAKPASLLFVSIPPALANRFAGRITHMHLQAPQPKERGGMYDLLEDARLDYRTLLPHILRRNPGATMTLEFVKDCIQHGGPFDAARVLANARRDAEFVEGIVAAVRRGEGA